LRDGKKILSNGEDKMIVVIPMLVWLRIVRVEIQLLVIRIQIEHVRVAIRVGNV